MNASDILLKLQDKMSKRNYDVNVDVEEGTVGTTRYTPPRTMGDREDDLASDDQFVDFPYVEDPDPYTTNRPLEGKLTEQPEDEVEGPEDAPEVAAAGAEPDMPPGEEGGEMIPGGEMPGGMPGEEGMPGMPGMEKEEPLTTNEIGRVYELKKIYSRLTSLESYLSDTTDQSLLRLRGLVAQSIDLFETVISNFPQFKEKVDEIIVMYYEFLDTTFGMLKEYYKKYDKEEE